MSTYKKKPYQTERDLRIEHIFTAVGQAEEAVRNRDWARAYDKLQEGAVLVVNVDANIALPTRATMHYMRPKIVAEDLSDEQLTQALHVILNEQARRGLPNIPKVAPLSPDSFSGDEQFMKDLSSGEEELHG